MRKKGTFLALVGCVSAVCCLAGLYSAERVMSEGISPAPMIIIDAGHGGFDGGASGADGTVEKDINLDISKRLACLAELGGFGVVMVREDDRAVCDDGLDTIREKKVSDIHNRLALTEKYPQALFISIHQNHFEQEKYWGTQVFYGGKNPQSRALARYIQRAVTQSLQTENSREIKKAEKNLYILYNTDSTAVMVECGFLSNREECSRLRQPEYQQQLAFEIARAAAEFTIFPPEGAALTALPIYRLTGG